MLFSDSETFVQGQNFQNCGGSSVYRQPIPSWLAGKKLLFVYLRASLFTDSDML